MLCLGYPISYEGGRVGILVVCFNVLLTVSALLAPAPSLHLADIQVIRVGSIMATCFLSSSNGQGAGVLCLLAPGSCGLGHPPAMGEMALVYR